MGVRTPRPPARGGRIPGEPGGGAEGPAGEGARHHRRAMPRARDPTGAHEGAEGRHRPAQPPLRPPGRGARPAGDRGGGPGAPGGACPGARSRAARRGRPLLVPRLGGADDGPAARGGSAMARRDRGPAVPGPGGQKARCGGGCSDADGSGHRAAPRDPLPRGRVGQKGTLGRSPPPRVRGTAARPAPRGGPGAPAGRHVGDGGRRPAPGRGRGLGRPVQQRLPRAGLPQPRAHPRRAFAAVPGAGGPAEEAGGARG